MLMNVCRSGVIVGVMCHGQTPNVVWKMMAVIEHRPRKTIRCMLDPKDMLEAIEHDDRHLD